jgi:hypothetical protein
LEPKLCNKEHHCAHCGDKLIHQFHRGEHESSSALGQLIHDKVTGKTSIVDADYQIISNAIEVREGQIHQLHFSSDLPRLRVIEHKKLGGSLSRSQKWVMPLWRDLIQIGARMGIVSKQSGVVLIEGDPPFDEIRMTHYIDEFGTTKTVRGSREQFINWMGGPR